MLSMHLLMKSETAPLLLLKQTYPSGQYPAKNQPEASELDMLYILGCNTGWGCVKLDLTAQIPGQAVLTSNSLRPSNLIASYYS